MLTIIPYAQQPTKQQVVEVLRTESNLSIEWFTRNLMLANPQKFQALFLNCKEKIFTFELDNVTMILDDVVKLLGVHLDSKLNFENHISHIFKKAGNHLNVLKRLFKFIKKMIEWRYLDHLLYATFSSVV